MGGGPDRSQTAITRSQPRASPCRGTGAVCDLVIDVIGGPMAANHIRHLLAQIMRREEAPPVRKDTSRSHRSQDHKLDDRRVRRIEGAAHRHRIEHNADHKITDGVPFRTATTDFVIL